MSRISVTFEQVKDNPNEVYQMMKTELDNICKVVGYRWGYDNQELMQQSYLYFRDLCEQYVPNYQGNPIPFDLYVYKKMWRRLQAHVQAHYNRQKREILSEEIWYYESSQIPEDYVNRDELARYLDVLSDSSRDMVVMWMQGYLQSEIAAKYDISQSRISVLISKALAKLRTEAEKNG